MTIDKFVLDNDIEQSSMPIDGQMLEEAEKAVGILFGNELARYLQDYGYLAYEEVELYGMNMRQGLESDMIKQTLYLHKYFPATSSYVALENQGEGEYYLVDSNDMVFEFISEQNMLTSTNMTMFEYIIQRLSGTMQRPLQFYI